MMEKYLLLLSAKESQCYYSIKNTSEVSIYNIYRHLTLFERIVRKMMVVFGISISCFYDSWKNDSSNYTKVILEDGTIDDGIFTYLRGLYPNAQIIYWFRNSLDAVDYKKSKSLHIKHAAICDRAMSFDQKDSLKYGYEYIENPYVKDKTLICSIVKYDMIFLGSDKSRFESIMRIVRYTERLKWNNYIYIYSRSKKDDKYVKNVFKPYREYLSEMVQSKVILDIVDASYQTGYSLRVFEALFYKKKLITNHKIIMNEAFYNRNNIYIIDPDNERTYDELDYFLSTPYVDIDDCIIRKYNFYDWIKRI